MTAPNPTLQQFRFAGVNQDLPTNMLNDDVYSSVLNMEPIDIGMKVSGGIARAYDAPLFPPEHLAFNITPDAFYWMYASSTGIGVTNGQTHFDITPAAGIASTWPTRWTSANLNGLLTLNNQIDVPVWWDNQTGNIMEPLPDWPANTTAGSIRQFKNNLIAMDIRDAAGDFTNQMMWSDFADPGQIPQSWTPLPENSAGFNTLSDTIGALVDGAAIRDSFLLFKDHSTYIMNFIGGNFVFAFRKLFTTSGILTTNCAAEYLGKIVVMTDGDVIITDGQRADSIIDKKNRRWLFNNIDSANYKNSFVVALHNTNQVWICFPENGETEPNLALIWDASDNRFGVRELTPKTPHIARGLVGNVTDTIDWDSDNDAWNTDVTSWNSSLFNATEDALLQADRVNTLTYAINESNQYDGVNIKANVTRMGLTFGDDEHIKLIKALWPRVSGNTGTVIDIRIGSSNSDSDPVKWSPTVQYTIGSREKVDTFAQGRFIHISLSSNADQSPWLVHGIEFDYNIQGRY